MSEFVRFVRLGGMDQQVLEHVIRVIVMLRLSGRTEESKAVSVVLAKAVAHSVTMEAEAKGLVD